MSLEERFGKKIPSREELLAMWDEEDKKHKAKVREFEPKAKILYGLGKPLVNCHCRMCTDVWLDIMDELDPDGWLRRESSIGMILCPTCGNKRCPHATNHELECTGSNESGQKGSAYE
ncbi:hypothetical protein PP304_gp055 [Gordonia phage Phendrix]|uniref:Uncharacterized protein n=1 Tax=Gordonia phage Phendrix TaxID=2593335 RepID=A0A514U0Y8_9CAUD|nr:hypothetical protein PP304_gp055 [Gordonia phage Phendrix]QDK02603.1 hypothetical protein SEA_PHENDRIX_55 [Gordonia phage Phendrix]